MEDKAKTLQPSSISGEGFKTPFRGLTLAELEEVNNSVIARAVERLKKTATDVGNSSSQAHSSHSSHRSSGKSILF